MITALQSHKKIALLAQQEILISEQDKELDSLYERYYLLQHKSFGKSTE